MNYWQPNYFVLDRPAVSHRGMTYINFVYGILTITVFIFQVFREHMIDGSTLPHLSEDHLLKFVSMKLGPAIRLKMAVADRVKSQSTR